MIYLFKLTGENIFQIRQNAPEMEHSAFANDYFQFLKMNQNKKLNEREKPR